MAQQGYVGTRAIAVLSLITGSLGTGARRVNRHRVSVAAPPERVYDGVLNVSLRELPVVRLLFRLRGIPYTKEMTVREFFTTAPFRLVSEAAPREIVFAVEGPGMRATGMFQVGDAASGSVLSTETWVETFSPRARRLFSLYWAVIGPFSGLIRRMLLSTAKRRAETPTAKE